MPVKKKYLVGDMITWAYVRREERSHSYDLGLHIKSPEKNKLDPKQAEQRK